jgi:hypothetical protein
MTGVESAHLYRPLMLAQYGFCLFQLFQRKHGVIVAMNQKNGKGLERPETLCYVRGEIRTAGNEAGRAYPP